MIKFINVSKFYHPNVFALRNVSFHIKPGEFVSFVGQSGAVKTTVLRLIITEEKPTKGKIIIGGWDIGDIRLKELPLLRRQIGVVFQDFKLLKKKTVYENIEFALQVIDTPHSKISFIINRILKIVGLEHKAQNFPYQLSAGEAQRAAIARAIVYRPKILLADEPTGNLDPINTREVIELLLKINELGITTLLVTHNREIVNLVKKRVITMDHGVIIGDQQDKGRYVI